jgi:CHAP domain
MLQTQLPVDKSKRNRRLLLLLTAFLIAAVLVPAVWFSLTARGQAHAASAAVSGSQIATIAKGQIGGQCSQYYGCPYPGEWCAEFAMWVWSHGGANTSHLTAGAGSFYIYGQKNHTLSNTPKVGDAVVFGYNGTGYAQHVAIVVSVNTSGHTIVSVGGNERGGAGAVAEDGPYNWNGGYSSYWGMNISGYIAPAGSGSPPPGHSAPVAAPGHQPLKAGTKFPTKEWWVTTFANAPGYYGGWNTDGTLYAGTNYVFCKEMGATVSGSQGHNYYWLWTDLDTGGPKGWVSAYYLSNWGNNVAKDNSGHVIPDC